jgi:cell wall-associated NlpC family hydrolase
MSIPLRVATCATALALTLTPDMTAVHAESVPEKKNPVVQVHRKQPKRVARWQSRARHAVRFAYRQLGKPYRWGGTGPRAYDCSGLVQRAWRAAGVRIPRVTYAQFRIRPHIRRRNLRPGDLVFFHGRGHVGIYVGRGRFIHAPNSGSRVKVQRLRGHYLRAFDGAVRPGRRR